MMAKKRILSWLVAASLALSLVPATALAADEAAPTTTPESAFGSVVDKIDEVFVDPDETKTDTLTNGIYDALNGTTGSEEKTTGDIYTEGKDGKDVVTGSVLNQVDTANNGAADLEDDLTGTKVGVTEKGFEAQQVQKTGEDGSPVVDEDGNPVMETVIVETGADSEHPEMSLDTFMDQKADAAETAAGLGQTAVNEANEAMEGLEELVAAGNVEAVQEIANTVAEKAAAADQAYEAAAIAHAQAEAALADAKARYDQEIRKALGDTITDEEFNALTDEQKAAKADQVIGAANQALADAQTALTTAQEKMATLKTVRDQAGTAAAVAGKYQEILSQLTPKEGEEPKELTEAEIVTILLQLKEASEWQKATSKDSSILEHLDKNTFDSNGLTDTAVDYALAEKAVQNAQGALDELEADETATSAATLTAGIQKNFEELIAAIKNLPANRTNAERIQEQFNDYASALDEAHKTLRDPQAEGKDAAQQSAEHALNGLFDGKYLGAGVVTTRNALVNLRNALWAHVGDKDDAGYNKVVEILAKLDQLETAEKAIRDNKYDQSVSNAKKDVNDAQKNLKDIDLTGALNAYLATIGTENGANADAAVSKAAQLAAVLRGITDKAYNEAVKKATDAQQAANEADRNLKAAQDAYDDALAALNKTIHSSLDGLKKEALFNQAQAELNRAKIALDAAKDAKDEADEKKKEADDAVDEAEENRRRIEEELPPIIDTTGATDDTGDDDTAIADGLVPLALMPTRGELMNYLYVRAGSPAAELSTFTDVPADHEFALAIGWAQANGIANGYADGTFDPDNFVIVRDMTAFLTNYARYAGMTMPTLSTMAGLEEDAIVETADEILAEFFGD